MRLRCIFDSLIRQVHSQHLHFSYQVDGATILASRFGTDQQHLAWAIAAGLGHLGIHPFWGR